MLGFGEGLVGSVVTQKLLKWAARSTREVTDNEKPDFPRLQLGLHGKGEGM